MVLNQLTIEEVLENKQHLVKTEKVELGIQKFDLLVTHKNLQQLL